VSGTLTTKGVRRALRDRIAAITPKASYTTDVSVQAGAMWHESPVPLVSAFAPPEPVQPLAFWIFRGRLARHATRTGRDSILVEAPITVRFLFPSRPKGLMATAADDEDACTDAAEHLLESLTEPEWGEVAGLSVDLGSDVFQTSYVGAGEVAMLCEVFLTVRYELG
jgi:hypothetical protein